eukprot:TRINITY_DN11987_c0_g1_i2.p1 TRINITY_DN11987_c0_g1~~TRINITY_DN11987_c0_g1_i2.p1  ORF type:complete len:249 (+),score=37.24 TRINITY_DN11987_c0_g1_i2:135-881(+)
MTAAECATLMKSWFQCEDSEGVGYVSESTLRLAWARLGVAHDAWDEVLQQYTHQNGKVDAFKLIDWLFEEVSNAESTTLEASVCELVTQSETDVADNSSSADVEVSAGVPMRRASLGMALGFDGQDVLEAPELDGAESILVEELACNLEESLVVDLRRQDRSRSGYIPDSIHLPLTDVLHNPELIEDLVRRIEDTEKKRIIFCCLSGATCSSMCAEFLASFIQKQKQAQKIPDIVQVGYLEGGMQAGC